MYYYAIIDTVYNHDHDGQNNKNIKFYFVLIVGFDEY